MFTQGVLLRKNTIKIKDALKKIGYKYSGKESDNKNLQYLYCFNGNYVECKNKPSRYNNIIDCETNDDLFLALAALRDDTDVGQWFVIDTEAYTDINKGDWFKSTDVNGKYHVGTKIDPLYCHKATVSEIIEHFK